VAESAPDLASVAVLRKQNNLSRIGDNVIEICRAADIVFMALHGEDGENGKMQALFDIEKIRYTGSNYLGSALAMNKDLAKTVMKAAGILVPDGFAVQRGSSLPPFPGYPCVVKPCSGGSSVGVSIVNTSAEYETAMELAFRYEPCVLTERFVKGRELTVGVFAGKAMPVIEIIPKQGFYDYRNKYQAGLTEEICPALIGEVATQRVQALGEAVYRALMLDVYCRVDCLMDEKGKIWCLEANTLPGMTPTSLIPQMAAAMGICYEEFCQTVVTESLKKYGAAK
jgi:D-alanine-D-alanine ligase